MPTSPGGVVEQEPRGLVGVGTTDPWNAADPRVIGHAGIVGGGPVGPQDLRAALDWQFLAARVVGDDVGAHRFALGGIAIAMWYFTSLFLQNVLGYSALGAGLGQTPAAVTFMVIARLAAALLPRTGVRPLVLAGSGCFVAGFGWLAQAHTDSGYVTSVLGPTLLIAVGIGLTFPTLMAAATADVPEGDAGIIGGLANTASQVGGSVGLAVLATVASARAGMEAGGGFPAALAAGYDLVFLMAAGLGLAIAVVSVLDHHVHTNPHTTS